VFSAEAPDRGSFLEGSWRLLAATGGGLVRLRPGSGASGRNPDRSEFPARLAHVEINLGRVLSSEYVLHHKKGLTPSAAPLRLGDPVLDALALREPDLSLYDQRFHNR
jgi:hypothetical protein